MPGLADIPSGNETSEGLGQWPSPRVRLTITDNVPDFGHSRPSEMGIAATAEAS
jgi:hypothetical protein